ncbi:flavin reductase family protein [Marivita sp. S0852]|uniref:flavin reductase family protein n=1 Tax=Marivita sp. S0852 TaxID=3373893 RepID=UPI0039829727
MNMQSTPNTPKIDPRELRNALGCFATGVCIVTSVGDGNKPVGMTINSFSSVSLDPPLVLWSINLKARSRDAYRRHAGFAINILCKDSKELSLNFAKSSDDKFVGVNWHEGHFGIPVLEDAMATLECETQDRIVSGDHEIYIGRVLRIDHNDRDPLVFHRGQFATLGTTL